MLFSVLLTGSERRVLFALLGQLGGQQPDRKTRPQVEVRSAQNQAEVGEGELQVAAAERSRSGMALLQRLPQSEARRPLQGLWLAVDLQRHLDSTGYMDHMAGRRSWQGLCLRMLLRSRNLRERAITTPPPPKQTLAN